MFLLRARRASKCRFASGHQSQASDCVSQGDREKSVAVSMSANDWTKSETRVSMQDSMLGLRRSMHDTAGDHCVNAGRASEGSRLPLDSAYEWACCEPRKKIDSLRRGCESRISRISLTRD
jgi:hypothetical protein